LKITQLLCCLLFLLAASARSHSVRFTIEVRDATVAEVLALISAESDTNIIADSSIKPDKITLRLANVSLDEALAVLVESQRLAVHRIGSVIVVGTAETMNRRYSSGRAAGGIETAVFTLLHADPLSAAKEITDALPSGTAIVADKQSSKVLVSGDRATVARARQLVTALDDVEFAGSLSKAIRTYRLRYARSADIAAALKAVIPDAVFVDDDAQNGVLVAGDENVQRAAADFVRSMDVASDQVLFEVRVADVRPVSEQSDIGIQLGGYDLSGQPVAGAAAYTFTRNALAINARLNALISSGHAEILATPRLLTLNNHEADLLIGETYPVTYFDARSGGQQVQFVDIGVKLRLTPTIGSDGSVTAEVHPEYSAIEGFVGGYPVLTSRKVDTRLRVRDGETIVLGGLLRDIDSEAVTRVPGLSSIPILGKLFQDRQRTHQRDEVVFLITPHIMHTRPSVT
jgi:type II secretory pathway component GspD/PulD (secretin)